MTELWKDIPGYEGLYQASTEGRIRSLDRNYRGLHMKVFFLNKKKGKIMALRPDKYGYLTVGLRKNGIKKWKKVHILVALAWIPNPQNLPCVNHKDEDKTNNFVFINPDGSVNPEKSNLEWCDWGYNVNYGTRNQRVSKAMTNGKLAKPIIQYTLKGEFVREWLSASEVERELGWNQGPISACCLHRPKYLTSHGYKWEFKKKRRLNSLL